MRATRWHCSGAVAFWEVPRYCDVIRHSAEERPIKHTLIFICLFTTMADDQLPYTEINATLTNILSELKGQKRELSSLKEDVRENCLAVSSDVKKLKIQRDLV